ncbi:putative reverse transcriptase domain-containing protein [Tanacetum coccineum]
MILPLTVRRASGLGSCYVSLIRKKFCWGIIFPIGLKRYRDPKEEQIEKKPLMEIKEIRLSRVGLADSKESEVGMGQGEVSKVENVTAKMLRSMDQLIERKEDGVEDYNTERLARLYIDEIVARHRVPVPIISDRDRRFTSRFWQTLQKALGMRLDMDFGGNWDVYLPLAKFSYNNSYHSSILCAPFEALVEVGDKVMLEVSSWKDVVHVGKKEMLAPRYVGPFEIIKGIGPMPY